MGFSYLDKDAPPIEDPAALRDGDVVVAYCAAIRDKDGNFRGRAFLHHSVKTEADVHALWTCIAQAEVALNDIIHDDAHRLLSLVPPTPSKH